MSDSPITLQLILSLLGLAGFILSFYIFIKKRKKQPLMCPMKASCTTVIHSDYSKIAGIPLEVIGILYYAFTLIVHVFLYLNPYFETPLVSFVLITLSSFAFLFTLYLIGIQAFALRSWCTWCLMSAFITTLIFITTLFTSEVGAAAVLGAYKIPILLAHTIGVILGVGAATITDIFFFRFLKDRKISEHEAEVMNTLSNVIWFAISLLIMTGFFLYLPRAEELNQTPKFLVKAIVVLVIAVNGVVLNLVISPKLMQISFGGEHHHKDGELSHFRRLAMALGGVSIVSWYTAFILGSFRNIALSFNTILMIYLSLLFLAVIGSQIFDYFFTNKKINL